MEKRQWIAVSITATLAAAGAFAGVAAVRAWGADARWFGDGASWDQSEPSRTELIVGDSLSGQFGGPLTSLAAQRAQHWEVWGTPGAAPCDVLASYGDRVLAMNPLPTRIALAFVGNVGNMHMGADDCMVSRLWPGMTRSPATLTADDRTRITSLYRQDMTQIINWNLAHNIQTVLIDPPVMQPGTYFNQVNTNLVTMYDSLSTSFGGVGSSHLVRDTLTPNETWRQGITATSGGTYPLRHTDGTHLAAPFGTQMYAAAAFAILSAP